MEESLEDVVCRAVYLAATEGQRYVIAKTSHGYLTYDSRDYLSRIHPLSNFGQAVILVTPSKELFPII